VSELIDLDECRRLAGEMSSAQFCRRRNQFGFIPLYTVPGRTKRRLGVSKDEFLRWLEATGGPVKPDTKRYGPAPHAADLIDFDTCREISGLSVSQFWRRRKRRGFVPVTPHMGKLLVDRAMFLDWMRHE
jgi:hypothetical protein